MGRYVRYAFFEEIAKKEHANKIATAHTKNDLAETTIMNILRGSGLSRAKRDRTHSRKKIHSSTYCMYKRRN